MLLTESQLRNHIYKRVKLMLTEGSWGYEPTDSDSFHDSDWLILLKMSEIVYDYCDKIINDASGGKHEYFDKGHCCWESIGIIEKFFDSVAGMDYTFNHEKGHEKYYVWWKLLSQKKKSIVGLYKRCVDYCSNNEKWIEEWSEPEKLRKSLKKRQKNLERFEKLLRDEYYDELEHENWRIEHEDEVPVNEKHDYTKTLKKYGGIDFQDKEKEKK